IYPRYVWNEMAAEQWDRIQAVNLRSCFLCSQAVFAYLKKQGAGKIINISSVTFWLGFPRNLVHYTASKGGVIGFTRALGARYWGIQYSGQRDYSGCSRNGRGEESGHPRAGCGHRGSAVTETTRVAQRHCSNRNIPGFAGQRH